MQETEKKGVWSNLSYEPEDGLKNMGPPLTAASNSEYDNIQWYLHF